MKLKTTLGAPLSHHAFLWEFDVVKHTTRHIMGGEITPGLHKLCCRRCRIHCLSVACGIGIGVSTGLCLQTPVEPADDKGLSHPAASVIHSLLFGRGHLLVLMTAIVVVRPDWFT